MASILFQPLQEEDTAQKVFAVIFSASQISNLAALIILPHEKLFFFKTILTLTLTINFIGFKKYNYTLFKKILDTFGLLEAVNIFKNQGNTVIRFTEISQLSLDKLKLKTLLPFGSLLINYYFVCKDQLIFANNDYQNLINMCLFLNSIIISCFFIFLMSNYQESFYYQHLIIILSIFSHLGLVNLCLHQISLVLVFSIRAISLIIQYLVINLNDQHPYKSDSKYIFLDLALKNLVFYPQNYGPFFKLGYFKYGHINYNEFDEIAKTHSFQVLFFLRVVNYLEMLVFLLLNILYQSEQSNFGFITIKIIVYLAFVLYSGITIVYFFQQLNKFLNKRFEYLTINYATPSEILNLINDSKSINFLHIHRVIQENQQQRSNYVPLENHEIQYQKLIKKLFQFIYQEKHQMIEQRIEIPNLFSLKWNSIQINSQQFLSHYLNHIRESKVPSRKKIVLTHTNKKLFNYQLNQALLDRLFNLGLDPSFFRFGTETCSSQFITNQYISQQLQLIAFRKFIKPNMIMNPEQLSYDLLE
ncbi:hypothetical protein ABPG74_021355 [Tetrahymena malaccensis]